VKRILGNGFDTIEHQQIVEVNLSAIGDALQLFDVLGQAFFGEGEILSGVEDGSIPVSYLHPISLLIEITPIGFEHLSHNLLAIRPDLLSHFVMASFDVNDGDPLAAAGGHTR
jgi:hypothetical protein